VESEGSPDVEGKIDMAARQTEVMRQPISLASNSPNVTTVPAGY
jgi:hypothetical protein